MKSPPAASLQQEALINICDSLDNLCARIERRTGRHACNADGYADRTVQIVAAPLRQVLGDYLDFHRQHTNEQGLIGQQHRQAYFDMIARAGDAQGKLTRLCDVEMQRIGTAPGSVARLSPYFKLMMDGEHFMLCGLRHQLQQVIRHDVARLKEMPRHLRLLTRAVD